MADIALRGNRLTAAKGGRASLRFGGGRTNLLEQLGRVEGERSNPNRRAEISRVHSELNRGYAKGGRAGHAAGSIIKKVIQGGKKIVDKIKTGKSNKFDTWETIGIPGSPGPHKGKYPAIDKVMKNIEKQKKKGIKEPGYDPDFKAAGGRIGKAVGGWTKHIPERQGPRGGHPGFTKESMYERAGGGEKGKPHSSKEGRIAAGERNMRRQRERVKKLLQRHRKLTPLAKGGKADKNWIQKAVNPKHKGYCTPMTKKTCTPRRKALARTFKKMGRERKAKG